MVYLTKKVKYILKHKNCRGSSKVATYALSTDSNRLHQGGGEFKVRLLMTAGYITGEGSIS